MQALEELQQRMAACPLGCPDVDTLQWHLRDSCLDPAAAQKQLLVMLKWRQEVGRVAAGRAA